MKKNLILKKKKIKPEYIGIFIGLLISLTLISAYYIYNNGFFIFKNKLIEEERNFSIYIPKLKIEAPIIKGVNPSKEDEYNKALTKGVVLMPSAGIVGESGNVVIYGHSSAQQKSPYQKIFAKIGNLKENDDIKINKDGKEYIYKIKQKKIIEATDFSILDNTKEETLTLITCWPIGTTDKRLVVIAKR